MNHSSQPVEIDPSKTAAPLRWVWIGAGFVFLAIGFIGAFVPVLPTTDFLILAAACFARGSTRWLNWLLALPTVGPLIRDYREGKGMPARAKFSAVSMLCVAVLFSVWRFHTIYGRVGVLALGAVGVWFILARVPTRSV